MENIMFDYIKASKQLDIPDIVLQRFEEEASNEFPHDSMLMELHVLRAINAYAAGGKRVN